jgi:hypothetical protein
MGVGYSFALLMSPIFVFLRDVWIRTQSAAVAKRRAINLAHPSLFVECSFLKDKKQIIFTPSKILILTCDKICTCAGQLYRTVGI